jgi:CheY-like chemotaxis protein
MRLDYWILWFEDKPSWLEPIQDGLGIKLGDLGFRLLVDRQSNGENLAKLSKNPKFDLVLMDFDLQTTNGEKVNGDELIRQIRQTHGVFTEIVFYSNKAVGGLRSAVFENGKSDGVYCFNRNDRDFSDSVMKIIDTTIKKVLDTNNMRGLAMASVANCDQHVIDAVVIRWGQLGNDAKEVIRQKALDKMVSVQTSIGDQIKAMQSEQDLRAILTSHGYPSQTRFNLLNSLTKSKKGCEIVGPVRLNLQSYPDVLAHRNRLGHARAIETDGVVIFEGHEHIIYDDAKFRELRQQMIIQENALTTLITLIQSGSLD